MKIACLLPGNNGDVMTAQSVLHYKDELWPGAEIVWYCSEKESEVLKHAPVEIRPWEDFSNVIYKQNFDFGLTRDKDFPSLKDIDKIYWPAPWMYAADDPNRAGLHYPLVSKRVFNVPDHYEWHPELYYSNEEHETVKDFCLSLPHKKTIMLETGCKSGQSDWDQNMTKKTMDMCRAKLGKCNFIFASKGDNPQHFNDPDNSILIDDKGVVTLGHFSVRVAALANNYSDLFIGISSGLSVATSAWNMKSVPKIQYTNTYTCSTSALANGPFSLIEIHGNKDPRAEYYKVLNEWLEKIK